MTHSISPTYKLLGCIFCLSFWASNAVADCIQPPGIDKVINMMVVYTPAAKAFYGSEAGVKAWIDAQYEMINFALRDSDTKSALRLAYVGEVAYTESGSMATDLDRFRFTDGWIDEIKTWATDHNAYYRVMVTTGPGGGLGFVGSAYSLITVNWSPNVMAHQMGHSFGQQHTDGHTFTAIGSTWRTVMKYPPGSDILRYSNKDQTFLGQPSGTVTSDSAQDIRDAWGGSSVPENVNALPDVTITSPADSTFFNAQDSITISVDATDSDGTIYQVDHYIDDFYLGTTTSPPHDILSGPLPVGEHILHSSAIDDVGGLMWSCPVAIIVQSELPLPWGEADVGESIQTGDPGSVKFSSGTFTTNGSGRGLEGSGDGFNFVHQGMCGNGEIVAHVASLTSSGAQAGAGVMIRSDLRTHSPSVSLVLSRDSGFVLHQRTSDIVPSTRIADGNVQAQGWVKIVRTGTTFDLFTSPDGAVWTPFATPSVTIAALSGNVLVGLSTTSTSGGFPGSFLTTATIDNVSLTDSSPCPTYTITFTRSPTFTTTPTHTVTQTYTYTPTTPPEWVGWTTSSSSFGKWTIQADATSNCPNSYSPNNAYWYGYDNGGPCDYDSGFATSRGLYSPFMVIPAGGHLRYWSWEETEDAIGTDARIVRIYVSGVPTIIHTSLNNDASYYEVDLDVSAWAGLSVQFMWAFYASGANDNFGGWYIDDVELFVPSPTPTVSATDTPTPTYTGTFTWTPTWSPTSTPSWTPTWTSTASPTGTSTWTPTWTPTHSPSGTDTHTSTWTPTWSPTSTPTYTPTWTPTWTPTHTPTHSPTYTGTFTWTPTWTPTGTSTWTSTYTPTWSPTSTATATGTDTHTSTWSPTFTYTPTYSPTYTPSDTLTHSDTITWTLTPSRTASLTPTSTWSPTGVPSTTVTPTSTFTPAPEDLSAVHPYPNPVDVVTGNETIRFADLSGDVEVRIYTASGRLVVALKNEASLELDWDLRNGRGQLVGAGIYFWVATNNTGGRKTGQLAIIK